MRVALFCLSLFCHSLVMGSERPWLPAELDDISPEAWQSVIEDKLSASSGEAFPNWKIAGAGPASNLFQVSHGALEVLYIGGACPQVIAELKALAAQEEDSARDGFVIVFKDENVFRRRDMRRLTRRWSHVYYIEEWDPSDIMNYIRIYPTYLYIGEDRTLDAFKVGSGSQIRVGG